MRGRRINLGLDRFSGIYLFAIIILVFGLWVPSTFLTVDTLHSVASEQAVTAMLGLGLLIPLTAQVFDLSIGAIANLSGIVAVWLQSVHHWAPATAIIVPIAVAVAFGIINGFFVVVLKVSSFITTLGVSTIVAAVQIIVTGNVQPNPPVSAGWSNLTLSSVGGFQIIVIYMLVIAFVLWWVMDHTPAGRYFTAVGSSPEAARLSGVRVGAWTWMALVISSLIGGIAGVAFVSQNGPSLSFGSGLLLPAFAAGFLGSTQFKPGRFNVWGTVLAVYVLAAGVHGLQLVTGVQWLSDMFNGVALLISVSFAVARGRARNSARNAGGVQPDGGGPDDEAAQAGSTTPLREPSDGVPRSA